MMVLWDAQGFMRFGWIKEEDPLSYVKKRASGRVLSP
jgi:hypothetical protein